MGLKNRKKVCFIGTGYEDMLLFVIPVLKVLGLKQLILDLTGDHRFYSCVPHVEGIDPEESILDLSGAGYAFLKDEGRKENREEAEYDTVFLLYDLSYLKKGAAFNEDTFVIISTDEQRMNIEMLEEAKLLRGDLLIVRNYTGAADKRLEGILKKISFDKVHAIPPSLLDLKTGIKAQYRIKYSFSSISGELSQSLMKIIGNIAGDFSEKEIWKAFKKAGKGKYN